MKKLFISMSVLALVLASCGDASGEATGEENDSNDSANTEAASGEASGEATGEENDSNDSANTEAASGEESNGDASASVDLCDCLMNAADENEAQACAPDKSMEELMQMAQDCADQMMDDAMKGM